MLPTGWTNQNLTIKKLISFNEVEKVTITDAEGVDHEHAVREGTYYETLCAALTTGTPVQLHIDDGKINGVAI